MSASGIAKVVLSRPGQPDQNIPLLPDANDQAAWFETRDIDFEHIFDKQIDAIVLDIAPFDDQENMEVYVKVKQRMKDPGVVFGPYVVNPSDRAIHPNPRLPEGRYFSFRFVDRRPSVLWKLTGIQLYGKAVGGRA